MTDLEVIALLLIACALCVANWRLGILICLVVGFLQDPLRKLITGEPVYLTALVGVPLFATLMGARLRKVNISFRPLHSWNSVLRRPLNLFILLVALQSVMTIFKTGSPTIAGIGMLSYLAPLPAILLGYQFGRSERDLIRLIRVYLIMSVVMVAGVYLAYAGYDWQVLKSVGSGLVIFSQTAGKLDLFSGFLRSPEIAAWHGATAVCLLILLALTVRGNSIFKVGSGLLIMFLMGALLLTGRRKFLVEVVLFASIYLLMLITLRKTAIKSALISKSVIVLVVGLAIGSVSYLYIVNDVVDTTDIRPYYERGVSVGSDVPQRVSVMTVESFQWVIAQNGIFGSGAGTGSQGSQHFREGESIVGSAAEGGLAKVLAELGVPGLLLLMWLVVAFARYMWSVVSHVREVDPLLSKLGFGLVAFLMTNGFVYTIAHQVFGDPFVLIILGFLLGFVMAMPKILVRKADERVVAENRRPASDFREPGLTTQPFPRPSMFGALSPNNKQ